MATGPAWNLDDPTQPYALWDPSADIKIPFGLDDWLAALSVGYADHEVIVAPPLECPSKGTFSAGTPVLVRMRVAAGAEYAIGAKYPFTLRVSGNDGTTRDERTFWLQLVQR